MTNSQWDLVSGGSHPASISAENKALGPCRLHTLQTTDTHRSVLNMAWSLEPARETAVCVSSKEQGTPGSERLTYLVGLQLSLAAFGRKGLPRSSWVYFLKCFLAAAVSTGFTLGTPEEGASSGYGRKPITDSFSGFSFCSLSCVGS